MLKASGHDLGLIQPDQTLKPPPPSIPGMEVQYFASWRDGMREKRHVCREAGIRARLPAVQADMRARKQRQGNHHE
jgi:hypothetical protein